MQAGSWMAYWGKAGRRDDLTSHHPLVFHCLDVAACGQTYLDRRPELLGQLARWLGLDEAPTRQLLVFLLAVHDIGKFAESFQYKVPELVEHAFDPPLPRLPGDMRHDAIGALFFAWLAEERRLPAPLPDWGPDLWNVLLAPAFGHHGMPPPALPPGAGMALASLREVMSPRSREAAEGFFAWCARMFLPGPLPASCDGEGAALASWWIAGLAVLADWIGSNTTWFGYAGPDLRALSPEEYWERHALPTACRAVEEAGVVSVRPRPYHTAEVLLPRLAEGLRPAQAAAAAIDIPPEPQLFVLEDATGSGKTEAALILAARLIDAGLADGLFFGLPTQATADQMFERVTRDVPAWFDDPSRATLVLAHGMRDQSHAFLRHLAQLDDEVPGEGRSATLRLTEWLAQGNKRALLAQIGVGTLDQALLAALRVRHQPLRLLGLFRKVLVVDEVHSYDPYMTQVLLRTLELHAASGGSAILLSATLPLALRSRLLATYSAGIRRWQPGGRATGGGRRRGTLVQAPQAQSLEYPLLTRWSGSFGTCAQEQAFPSAGHSRRAMDVEYLTTEDQVLDRIAAWHAAGEAVVWVRNTVGDACAAWSALAEHFGADACTLFHARFATVDRRRIQEEVLATLGRDSDAARRRGRIIVTTQVFQESLDADADRMVTDLCPVDVMLQRFGRYRRHLRDARGNLLRDGQAGDGRQPGPVVVFGPDREAEPAGDWYARFSRGAAHVYAAHGCVYRSARAIGRHIELPGQFRTLVEEVYGEDGEPIPDALQTAEDRELGKVIAQGAQAGQNAISLSGGYCGADWDSDERIGTRLGDSIEVVLVRATGHGLEPWAAGRCGQDEDVWALSSIRVPGHWLAKIEEPACLDVRLAALVADLRERVPALRYRLVLPLVEDGNGTWSCTLAGGPPLSLSYCDRTGLRRGKRVRET